MFEQNCPSSQVAVSPYAKNSVNFRIFNVTLIPNSYSPKLQTDDEHRFPVVNGVGDESESTEKSTVVEEFSDPRRKNGKFQILLRIFYLNMLKSMFGMDLEVVSLHLIG